MRRPALSRFINVAALGGLLVAIFLFLGGCARQDRLVVYADPWLEDYANELCEAYQQAHPDTEIQLKLISTEVIAQHIHFGQPIDVALCFGSEWILDQTFRTEMAEESPLASSQIVDVQVQGDQFARKAMEMGAAQSVMIEASDRPARRYAEAEGWWQNDASHAWIIANFQRQAEDYLLRGWVPRGIVPIHFLRAHPETLTELRRGRLIPNAFTAIQFRHAPHPAQAAAFFAFTNSKKSDEILGELKFLP
jgi:ABC-type molybdate transport system substrate-binding protein